MDSGINKTVSFSKQSVPTAATIPQQFSDIQEKETINTIEKSRNGRACPKKFLKPRYKCFLIYLILREYMTYLISGYQPYC